MTSEMPGAGEVEKRAEAFKWADAFQQRLLATRSWIAAAGYRSKSSPVEADDESIPLPGDHGRELKLKSLRLGTIDPFRWSKDRGVSMLEPAAPQAVNSVTRSVTEGAALDLKAFQAMMESDEGRKELQRKLEQKNAAKAGRQKSAGQPQPAPNAQQNESRPVPPVPSFSLDGQTRLKYNWTFYFNSRTPVPGTTPQKYEKTPVQKIGHFDTLEEFWCYYNNLVPVFELPTWCNLFCFRANIRPTVSDEANVSGGEWVVPCTDKDSMKALWAELILTLIGGQNPHDDEMCGLVLSIRPKGDSLHLWHKTLRQKEAISAVIRDHRARFERGVDFPKMTYSSHKDVARARKSRAGDSSPSSSGNTSNHASSDHDSCNDTSGGSDSNNVLETAPSPVVPARRKKSWTPISSDAATSDPSSNAAAPREKKEEAATSASGQVEPPSTDEDTSDDGSHRRLPPAAPRVPPVKNTIWSNGTLPMPLAATGSASAVPPKPLSPTRVHAAAPAAPAAAPQSALRFESASLDSASIAAMAIQPTTSPPRSAAVARPASGSQPGARAPVPASLAPGAPPAKREQGAAPATRTVGAGRGAPAPASAAPSRSDDRAPVRRRPDGRGMDDWADDGDYVEGDRTMSVADVMSAATNAIDLEVAAAVATAGMQRSVADAVAAGIVNPAAAEAVRKMRDPLAMANAAAALLSGGRESAAAPAHAPTPAPAPSHASHGHQYPPSTSARAPAAGAPGAPGAVPSMTDAHTVYNALAYAQNLGLSPQLMMQALVVARQLMVPGQEPGGPPSQAPGAPQQYGSYPQHDDPWGSSGYGAAPPAPPARGHYGAYPPGRPAPPSASSYDYQQDYYGDLPPPRHAPLPGARARSPPSARDYTRGPTTGTGRVYGPPPYQPAHGYPPPDHDGQSDSEGEYAAPDPYPPRVSARSGHYPDLPPPSREPLQVPRRPMDPRDPRAPRDPRDHGRDHGRADHMRREPASTRDRPGMGGRDTLPTRSEYRDDFDLPTIPRADPRDARARIDPAEFEYARRGAEEVERLRMESLRARAPHPGARDSEAVSRGLWDTKGADVRSARGSSADADSSHGGSEAFDAEAASQAGEKQKGPTTCWFCLDSAPELTAHLVISRMSRTYLSAARGGIVPNHLVLSTYEHIPMSVEVDQETDDQINAYKRSLTEFFRKLECEVVIFEMAEGAHHLNIQIVPIPHYLLSAATSAFITEGLTLGAKFRFVKPNTPLKEIVQDKSYFCAELADNRKIVHVIFRKKTKKKKRLPKQFGRRVMAQLLDLPQRFDWRQCCLTHEQEVVHAGNLSRTFERHAPEGAKAAYPSAPSEVGDPWETREGAPL